jgi:beta-galactosidase
MQTIWVISDSYASWTHPGYEGKPVVVEVYAAGDEVELFQNGVSLGKKPAGEAANYRTLFELTYEPGTLHAVSYENGVEIGKSDLTTAADAKLTLHKETLPQTEENNLIYVEVTNEDAFGVVSDAKELTIHAQAEGGAVILGFGSANPKTAYNYITDETETFHGRAQLILKRTDKDVPVTVTVTADGQEASIQI